MLYRSEIKPKQCLLESRQLVHLMFYYKPHLFALEKGVNSRDIKLQHPKAFSPAICIQE